MKILEQIQKIYNLKEKIKAHKAFNLLKHSFIYGIGSTLQRFLSVLLMPVYTRFLTPDDYGIIAIIVLLEIVLGAISSNGLLNGIGRYFFYSKQEKTSISNIIWSPLIYTIIFSSILFIPFIIFSKNISFFFFQTDKYSYLIKLSIISLFISNIINIGRSVLIFQEKPHKVNFILIFQVIVGIAGGIYFVTYLRHGINGVFEAKLVTVLITIIPVLVMSVFRFKPSFSFDILKKQLIYSLPLVGTIIAYWVIDSSDRYMLNLFLPLNDVGLYNIGYNIGLGMMIIIGGFTLAWPPFYHKNNQENQGQQICNSVLKIYITGASIFVVFLSLFSPIILKILTTPKFYMAYTVVPWITLAYLLKGPYIIFMMGVRLKNKTFWIFLIELIAAILNILLNIIFIPIFKREGAAISTLIAYLFLTVGSYYLVNKINPIPKISKKYIFTILALTAVFSFIVLFYVIIKYYLLVSTALFAIYIVIIFKNKEVRYLFSNLFNK